MLSIEILLIIVSFLFCSSSRLDGVLFIGKSLRSRGRLLVRKCCTWHDAVVANNANLDFDNGQDWSVSDLAVQSVPIRSNALSIEEYFPSKEDVSWEMLVVTLEN